MVPLFWFTEIKLGGFGFSPLQISLFIGGAGISQALWVLIAFPPLQHRFGTGGVLRACSIAWPITFAFWPITNLFLRYHWDVAFWVVAPINLTVGSGVSMAFSKSSHPRPSAAFECKLRLSILTYRFVHSCHSTSTQRHRTHPRNTRYAERNCAYIGQCHPSLFTCSLLEYFCHRGGDAVLRWPFGMACFGYHCAGVHSCDSVAAAEG